MIGLPVCVQTKDLKNKIKLPYLISFYIKQSLNNKVSLDWLVCSDVDPDPDPDPVGSGLI